jgi:hypothetical protein
LIEELLNEYEKNQFERWASENASQGTGADTSARDELRGARDLCGLIRSLAGSELKD